MISWGMGDAVGVFRDSYVHVFFTHVRCDMALELWLY
jgi:hypothetical protein